VQPDSRIFIAGHRGLVGGAIRRLCEQRGFTSLLLRDRAQVDLREAQAVERFFAAERPEYVFVAAAKVGGIHANDSRPADFIRDNLLIEANLIDAAWRHGVRKLLFLGSSCIYPKLAPQPLREEYLNLAQPPAVISGSLVGSSGRRNSWG
jgi:GDP-L-fucose synthase